MMSWQICKIYRDHGRGEAFEAINWGRNSRLDSLNKSNSGKVEKIRFLIFMKKLANVY